MIESNRSWTATGDDRLRSHSPSPCGASTTVSHSHRSCFEKRARSQGQSCPIMRVDVHPGRARAQFKQTWLGGKREQKLESELLSNTVVRSERCTECRLPRRSGALARPGVPNDFSCRT
jgi:hypothetical protein